MDRVDRPFDSENDPGSDRRAQEIVNDREARRAVRAARRDMLEDAAIQAEMATGLQERTEQAARRNVVLRLGTIVVGFVVLLGGLAMMVLPGPGIVGILAGLGILSRELAWAERMMEYVKKRAKIEELKQQPAWVQGVTWTVTVISVVGSITYLTVLR